MTVFIPKPYVSERLDETASFSASGNINFANAMPYHKDILGILFDLTCQVDSGSSVSKTDDNLYQLLSQLKVSGDGEEIVNLKDMEIKWLSWLLTGEKPEELETPDATSQADQACYIRFYLPLGIKVGAYKQIKVTGTWGAEADPDGGTNFNVDSAILSLTVFLGKAPTQYYTKFHEDTKDGNGQQVIPEGHLHAIIMQTDGRDDNIDTIKLNIGGTTVYNSNHEANSGMAKQQFGIDFVGADDVDAQKETAINFIDGQNRHCDGQNASIHYKTSTSDTLYILYVFSKKNY